MQNKWINNSNPKDKHQDRIKSAIRITNMVNVLRTMQLHISISKKALQ